jgi:ABC-type glycerol-3-phosphate transport system substrate-binding protein
MMFMGAWLPIEMTPQMPSGFECSLFAFPNVEGGKGNKIAEYWANVYGVLKSTKYPDAAAKYLKYVTSKKIGTRISELGSHVATADVPDAPPLKNHSVVLAAFKTMPARAGLDIEIPDYMANVYNTCDDKLFKLQINPQQFIDCMKSESKNYWAKTK